MNHRDELLVPAQTFPFMWRAPRMNLHNLVLQPQVMLHCALKVDAKVTVFANMLADALWQENALGDGRL